MEYILTNGKYYICSTDTGATMKTKDIGRAKRFQTEEDANKYLTERPGKTKGCHIEPIDISKKKNGKCKRVYFPAEVRRQLYHMADGRCLLCGKKITYEKMTIDHIVPLAVGGLNSVENLQCTCKSCNQFKGSILPNDFLEKVSEIFTYQMEEKYKKNFRWKIARRLIGKLA